VECLKKSDVKKIAVEETNLSNLLSSMHVKWVWNSKSKLLKN
jgi:hypothetical protein